LRTYRKVPDRADPETYLSLRHRTGSRTQLPDFGSWPRLLEYPRGYAGISVRCFGSVHATVRCLRSSAPSCPVRLLRGIDRNGFRPFRGPSLESLPENPVTG